MAAFIRRNEPFTCAHCGLKVEPAERTCRNHCPRCLYSMHVDVDPGDRANPCGGLMEPVRVEYHSKKGYQIVHRCTRCGQETRNIALIDVAVQPDDRERLYELMRNPR
ncbi:RNHCP domain-containing protein [Alicyclobacillus fructus]|uniref:RNHCP domain-containing protein n=1 Tax=Alicyclobacillus fructus TaxID=2816082 RepID=UPI001A909989|nr:RNHCP domain-containing protein [Alicyclobacillus fructus]